MNKTESLIEAIDALLPQTQCRLCSYPGCRPYAEAIAVSGEQINRCLPGGVKTLTSLAHLLGLDPQPLIPEMNNKAKPSQRAVIREVECIGCTKCIQACPVDAIIGASKLMHTVIADICTGCELCIAPCPVDCIDLIPSTKNDSNSSTFADQSRQRYQQSQKRLARQKNQEQTEHQATKLNQDSTNLTMSARQTAIKEAVARSLSKKTAKTA